MSFGYAFTKGLVGGFTKNIEREREARGADEERIASLENFMFEAATDPKKEIPKELANIIKGAKEQVANRKPINIFGMPGERLNLDMSNLQKTINNVDKNMISIGSYSFRGTPTYFDDATQRDDYARSNQFWQSLESHLAIPENVTAFRNHFKNNKFDLSVLNSTFRRNNNLWMQGYTKNNTVKGKDNEITSMPIEKVTNLFGNVNSVWDLFTKSDEDGSEETADALSEYFEKYKNRNKSAFGVSNEPDKLGLTGETFLFPYEKDDKTFAYAYQTKDKQEIIALKEIAKQYGYDNVNRFLFVYGKKHAPNGLFQLDEERGLLLGIAENDKMIREDAYGFLFHAVELRKLGLNKVAPDSQKVFEYLDDAFGSGKDREKILALSIAYDRPTAAGKAMQANNQKTIGMPREKEIEKLLGGVKKSVFNEGFNQALKAERDLKKLLDLTKEITTSEGIVKKLIEFGYGIAGEGGQFSQIYQSFVQGSVVNPQIDNQAAFNATIRRVFNKGPLDELGQIESMKISLAFTLARAADPSGRLSNQDFEVQLRRLGTTGLFTNKFQQIAALETVLGDVEEIVRSKKLIHSIINRPATGKFSVVSDEERRVLNAAKQYHTLRKQYSLPEGLDDVSRATRRSFDDLNSEGEIRYKKNLDGSIIDTESGDTVNPDEFQIQGQV